MSSSHQYAMAALIFLFLSIGLISFKVGIGFEGKRMTYHRELIESRAIGYVLDGRVIELADGNYPVAVPSSEAAIEIEGKKKFPMLQVLVPTVDGEFELQPLNIEDDSFLPRRGSMMPLRILMGFTSAHAECTLQYDEKHGSVEDYKRKPYYYLEVKRGVGRMRRGYYPSSFALDDGNALERLRAIYFLANDGLDVQYLRQLVTSDPSRSRRIMFQTETPLTEPTIEIVFDGELQSSRSIRAESRAFTDDDRLNNQYSALIEGLEPNAEYRYRIVDGERKSAWHPLKTSGARSFKALIFPDSQCADYGVWKKLARDAFDRNRDAELVINMGDLVDNGEDWTQWRAWFEGARFLERIPLAPLMGNHETYGRQWTVREPIAYLNFFEVPPNGDPNFERYYYSFDFGGVHFSVLNAEPLDGLLEAQTAWLRRDVGSSNSKRKVVLMHRDVLQYRINGRDDREEGFSKAGLTLMPLFDELGIDLVLTAHFHTYRNRGRIFDFARSEQPPRGALYILTGNAGDVRYPDLWIDHALDVSKAPQPETDNYLTLEVSEEALDVKCFLPDGSLIDHSVLED